MATLGMLRATIIEVVNLMKTMEQELPSIRRFLDKNQKESNSKESIKELSDNDHKRLR